MWDWIKRLLALFFDRGEMRDYAHALQGFAVGAFVVAADHPKFRVCGKKAVVEDFGSSSVSMVIDGKGYHVLVDVVVYRDPELDD